MSWLGAGELTDTLSMNQFCRLMDVAVHEAAEVASVSADEGLAFCAASGLPLEREWILVEANQSQLAELDVIVVDALNVLIASRQHAELNTAIQAILALAATHHVPSSSVVPPPVDPYASIQNALI